jgi:hypothetical protein
MPVVELLSVVTSPEVVEVTSWSPILTALLSAITWKLPDMATLPVWPLVWVVTATP